MIVTIPGNFKYGGWDVPVMDRRRQPAYLLDRELPLQESEIRNAIYTNSLILQGVKQLVMKHTTGDILLIGHSTSGEIAMLAYEDKELGPRLKGRFLGWGSGGTGAARTDADRQRQRRPRARRAPRRRANASAAARTRTPRPGKLFARLQRFPQSALRGGHVASADCRALARRLKRAGARISSSSCRTSSTARISARRRRSSTKSRSC